MIRALRGLAALTLFVAVPLAAQGPISDRMLELPGKPYPESTACRLQGGDFRLTGAGTKLSTALTNSIPENKRRLLAEGRELTLQSIQSGQAGSSKAWYFLGRFYLQEGDLAGADSAFARTLQLAPACASEVRSYRVRAWGVLISAAAGHRTAGRADSALYLARAATKVDPDRPQAWYAIGTYYLDQQQNDSAAIYLLRALNSPVDSSPNAVSIRQAAAYQVAVVSYNAHDFTGAAHYFSEALRLKPDDADARRNLAASLRQAGMVDSASKVEESMMGAAAGSEGGLTVGQLFDIGVAQYNGQKFADAAATFEKIIAVEPNNRDALFNLAQSYKGASNADKLLETALRLRAIDPLSYEVLQLVGTGTR
ncbi:MAG: tetratricopeptide repeat protein, partial [Gemmatimonadota bacterium]